MLQNPTTQKHTKPWQRQGGFASSKWLSQWPLLSKKQQGDKKWAPTLTATIDIVKWVMKAL